MKFTSVCKAVGNTPTFPDFTGERVYMVPFTLKEGLPSELKRWDDVVNSMLVGVETEEPIYVMIDQKFVKKDEYHRRPGMHIDGYWNPGLSAHGSRHNPTGPVGHGSSRGWAPVSTHIPTKKKPKKWSESSFDEKEAIILTSNEVGCVGWNGRFYGPVGEGGDLEDVRLGGGHSVIMEPNQVYQGNITMAHVSIPAEKDMYRSVVRLNVPGWHP